MKIGLFFGSFNPPHIGHALIAQRAQEQFNLDKVYFIVSPHNPFKKEDLLAPVNDRYHFINTLCLELGSKFKPSDIEFQLPKPSYTCNTLRWITSDENIENKSQDNQYYIIMGMDCINSIDKWKDFEYIVKNFQILVYKRLGDFHIPLIVFSYPIEFINAPIIEISSTEIRQRIKDNKTVKYLIPESVLFDINATGFYR